MKAYQLFIEEESQIIKVNPGLRLIIKKGVPQYCGTLFLNEIDGALVDEYQIEIICTENYPHQFPIVFETGNRILRAIDWHIYPVTGACCISHPKEELLITRKKYTLLSFIENQVKPYFFNQTHRIEKGYYLHERAHNRIIAEMQFLAEELLSNQCDEIVETLNHLIAYRTQSNFHEYETRIRYRYRHFYERCNRVFKDFTIPELLEFINNTEIYLKMKGNIIVI